MPRITEAGPNHFLVSITVVALEGTWVTSTFENHQADAMNQQLAAHPITVAVIMGSGGLSFSLYTANEKS
jgi:hypothetical protein